MPDSQNDTDSSSRPTKKNKSDTMTQHFLDLLNSSLFIPETEEENEDQEQLMQTSAPAMTDFLSDFEEIQKAMEFTSKSVAKNSLSVSTSGDRVEGPLNLSTKGVVGQKKQKPSITGQKRYREESTKDLPENYTCVPMDEQTSDSVILENHTQQLGPPDLNDIYIEENPAAETLPTSLDSSFENTDSLFQGDYSQDMNCSGTHTLEEMRNFEMWWYDAYGDEDRGDVYLFGKRYKNPSDGYTSCCVIVKNIQRELYVLPRKFKLSDTGNLSESVGISDTIEEIESVLLSNNIRAWKTSVCTRKYVFGLPNIPLETQKDPELPRGLTGKTFQHIFGTTSSPLERFIIERKIAGPCWISFEKALLVDEQHTWSKANVIVQDLNLCKVVQTPKDDPPMKILSIKCQKSIKNEIISINGALVYKDLNEQAELDPVVSLKFSVIRLFPNTSYPEGIGETIEKERLDDSHEIRLERSEFALLSYITAKIDQIDPDVIVGHKIWRDELNILFRKMKQNNISYWHKLGRLQPKIWPRLNTNINDKLPYSMRLVMSGRLVCDIFLASQELTQCKSYDLSELAKSQLNIDREEIDLSNLIECYKNSMDLVNILKHGLNDAYISLCITLKLQVLPMSLQLTRIAGNLWSSNIHGGSHIDRNEYLLQHVFYDLGYICPDKNHNWKSFRKNNESQPQDDTTSSGYSGGLVLEPKSGLYEKYVVLLDFNSLYPSIIREYNMCFTTMDIQGCNSNDVDIDKIFQESGVNKTVGILPKIIEKFVIRRQLIKKLMLVSGTSPSLLNQYNNEQRALKLIANTIYGCLGSPFSRFYTKPLAMSITAKGRYILQNTVDLAGELELDVIYGDTDSIMIRTEEDDFEKVKEIAMRLKSRVNSLYEQLQIDVDSYFKHILLVKKKRYAGIKISETTNSLKEVFEAKGIETTRKDFCDFSQNSLRNVLEMFFSKMERSKITEGVYDYLKKLVSITRSPGTLKNEFVIRKKLSKFPDEYKDIKRYPHVIVAIEMKKRGYIVHSGDYIQFFMCKDIVKGEKYTVPKTLEDVYMKNAEIDYDWYILNQIILPTVRLYDPIGNMDGCDLANYIGIKYVQTKKKSKKSIHPSLRLMNDPKRFDLCEKLYLTCALCECNNKFDGLTKRSSNNTISSSLACNACGDEISIASALTQTILAVRSYINKYYQSPIQCDNPLCGFEANLIINRVYRCPINECYGNLNRKFSERMLYLQLSYFCYLFNTEEIERNLGPFRDNDENLGKMLKSEKYKLSVVKSELEKYIRCSDYRYLDLSKVI